MSRFTGKPGVFAMEEEARRRRSGAAADPDPGAKVHANMQHAKVYCLVDDGNWNYQGTGHVTIDYIEGSGEIALAVVDENDNYTILVHKITSDDIYEKEERILSLKDPEKAIELKLSFQEVEGCAYIWKNMLSVQEKLRSVSLGITPCPTFQTPKASNGLDESSDSDELKDLPLVELSNLPLLLETVSEWEAKDPLRIAKLISRDHEFFPKLVELFKMCEGSRKMDKLHMIFRLVKGIISLNNFEIFHKIFSDEFILDIIGALEYDPEAPNVQSHRAFVQNHVTFNEAVPTLNASVASKIHQTYRIGYIKDVILWKALDDATVNKLDSIIHRNNALVASVLKDDASFIKDLFVRMRSSNISTESKGKLALFLRDFCVLSKSLHPGQQIQLSRDLVHEGLIGIIRDLFQSQDKVLVSAGVEILKHFLDQDPKFRGFIVQHEVDQEGNSLLGILVQGMVIDSGEGMQYQCCLSNLLGSSDPKKATNCKEVIDVFFDKHLHKLIDVISSCCAPKGIARSTSSFDGVDTMAEQHSAKTETLLYICNLLSFSVCHHPSRTKLNFFASNAMEKILTLTRRREKVLVVAAVQFMRTIIGRKDEFLISHVIRLNLLKTIIEAFVENGNRENLLHSVVLELLEYIGNENLESLVKYVTETFWDQLMDFERLGSIQAFRLKYQQIVESAETKDNDTRNKADERGADKEQKENKDSDGEDSAKPAKCAQKKSIPARHKSDEHADCDNDNDYNPPLRKPSKADEAGIPMVKSRPDGALHTFGEAGKRPKIQFRLNFAKSVASANVKADTEVPLSAPKPSTSTESSEGSGISQNQQHAPETCVTTKSTDSEPN